MPKIYSLQILFFFLLSCFSEQSLAQADQVQRKYIDTLFSEILKENRAYWVQLPENYSPENQEKYPVVFLLDGFSLENSLEAVYSNYWGHFLPHMILVGIGNRENRTRDLTTSEVVSRNGGAMNMETGGAETFTQFIEKELIPHIDQVFPTTNYRTLIGHSYAGLFTINVLLNHSSLFHNYLAIDPTLDWDGQKVLLEAKEKLKTENFKGKSLFVSLAAEQLHMMDESVTMDNIRTNQSPFTLFARSIIEFSDHVMSEENSGLKFSWKVYPEDLHGTVPLPSMRDGLVFCFDWFQYKTPQKYNNPETTLEELNVLIEKQRIIYEENFGYPTPPMVEELFVGYGFMNLQMEQPEKAMLFFKKAITYYPNSADAHEGLADLYESLGDRAKAEEYITKAYNLSKSAYHLERMEIIKSK